MDGIKDAKGGIAASRGADCAAILCAPTRKVSGTFWPGEQLGRAGPGSWETKPLVIAKKEQLVFRIGPPKVPPNWLYRR